jgi:thiamine-phosphate pyrophosphorylase
MSSKAAPSRPLPRLYLATPVIDDPSQLTARLAALVASFDVAAVLVRLSPSDPRTLISHIKTLAAVIQAGGAALLLDGHADLVARSGADGAHLAGIEALQEALPALKPDRIAGAGGLSTRHDSMIAGEAGADYVLFGEPDHAGERPSTDAIAERLKWWAELFEPPCVGYAASCEETRIFAASGADFILADEFVWNDPRGAETALAEVAEAVREGHGLQDGRATSAATDAEGGAAG